MALALTLAQAAGQAFDNLHIRWQADQLKSNLAPFCVQSLAAFPQSAPESNPVSNWLAQLSAVVAGLPNTDVPIVDLTRCVQMVYRLCWNAFSLIGNGISTAQASVLLARYNVFIGF